MGEPTVDDLVAFGYAPGNYMVTCRTCRCVESGCDKRAYTCQACATKAFHANQSKGKEV